MSNPLCWKTIENLRRLTILPDEQLVRPSVWLIDCLSTQQVVAVRKRPLGNLNVYWRNLFKSLNLGQAKILGLVHLFHVRVRLA